LPPTILLQALNALRLLAIPPVQIDIRVHMAPTAGEFRAAKGALFSDDYTCGLTTTRTAGSVSSE